MERVLTEATTYSDLISKAYLACIRSVLIIDDEYPTMEGFLGQDASTSDKDTEKQKYSYKANPADVLEIVKKLRNHNPPLLVDIHDGSNILPGAEPMSAELSVAKHLHQSDFVVLDFSLDPVNVDDPSKAIAILRMLAKNSHFNLVMMHSNSKPDAVFQSIALGLLESNFDRFPCDAKAIADSVDYLDDLSTDYFDILSTALLGDKLTDHSAYLAVRRDPRMLRDPNKMSEFPFKLFTDKCDELSVQKSKRVGIACKILSEHHARHAGHMSDRADYGVLSFSDPARTDKPRWLKCDTLFVGFTSKQHKDNLIDEMRIALEEWSPQPPRLLMRRLVVELDENGARAENIALGTKYASARWYRDLLAAPPPSRGAHILELVNRHTETLLAVVEDDLTSFAKAVIALENEGTPEEICLKRFEVDLDCDKQGTKAITEHNYLISTVPVKGTEITTGHIFKIGQKFWLCLSAACDLVSIQKSPARAKVFGESGVPILAISLFPVSEDVAAANATDKRYIYLKQGSKFKFLCVSDPTLSSSKNWDWHNFISTNDGVFTEESREITLSRLEESRGKLVVRAHKAEVVGQLRYTYAAALASELGNQMTRIGLGYVKRAEDPDLKPA